MSHLFSPDEGFLDLTAQAEPKNELLNWTSKQKVRASRAWWRTPLIPALGRQRQADFWVRGQPGLQSEFQDSQGYTERPCLKKKKKKKLELEVMVMVYPLSTEEAETGRSLWVWGQPGLHSESQATRDSVSRNKTKIATTKGPLGSTGMFTCTGWHTHTSTQRESKQDTMASLWKQPKWRTEQTMQ